MAKTLVRRGACAVMLLSLLIVFNNISFAQTPPQQPSQPPAQTQQTQQPAPNPPGQLPSGDPQVTPQQPGTPGAEQTSREQTAAGQKRAAAPREVIIKGGTVLTVTKGVIQNGTVHVRDGKIAAVGANIATPPGALVIDATGKYVMPGIIDAHSHMSLGEDTNEPTSPITPHMMMVDAFQYNSKDMYRALAGGVTSAMLLHGSANMIGGQALVIKNKIGRDKEEMLFPGAPRSIKFASGENPKRVYGGRQQMPATRMGNFAVQRQALQEARDYMREWEDYERKTKAGEKDAKRPKKDLKLEALADVLRGNLLVQVHCYRADEFLTEMAMAKEFGYKVRAFHHAVEAYKVAEKMAAEGVAIATWADWYGFKHEAWDGIPWNAAMANKAGVRVAIHSDSEDQIRRLNQEAAKTMRYGGVSEEDALKMITINPAWIVGVDARAGSLEVGKDADIGIWNGHPLSTAATVQMVLIDGQVFFDRSLPGYGVPGYYDGPTTMTATPAEVQ